MKINSGVAWFIIVVVVAVAGLLIENQIKALNKDIDAINSTPSAHLPQIGTAASTGTPVTR